MAGYGSISQSSAQLIAGSLSSVSVAAKLGTGAFDSSSSGAVLPAIISTLQALSSSQLGQFTTPGEAPVAVTSDNIAMSVSLVHPTAGNSTPSLAGITAPGAGSVFAPLPPGALAAANGSAVNTVFMSLAFDPWAADNAASAARAGTTGAPLPSTGMTRLAFSSPGGVAVPVVDLLHPIAFTLPVVSASNGTRAACSWWNASAGVYATRGCVALPNPLPPNHTAYWVSNYTTPTDGALASAWNISGPLLANCTERVLDCPALTAAGTGGKLYFNPWNPFDDGAVACDNTTGPLRVFYGPACEVWRPENAYNCSWVAALQAFQGAGCVAPEEATQCLCRHLTDFVAVRTPTIAVASVSQLTSLSAADVFVKLRFLLYVVAGLFAFMNAGIALGYIVDARERKKTLKRLLKAECGFEQLPNGVWCVQMLRVPIYAALF